MQLLCLAPHAYQTMPDTEAQRFVPGEVYDVPDPMAIRILQDWGPDSVRLNGQEPRFMVPPALVKEPEPMPEPPPARATGPALVVDTPLDSFTIEQLNVIAAVGGVDLTGITKKADIIAAIEGALQ